MGSIGDEMNTIENLPSLPPIGSEMNENEKIPGIEEITSMQIPLSFEEEEPLEKSHATSSDFIPGHANTGHTNSSHANPTASSSNETTADARRREFVASNPGDFLETKSIHRLKLRSSQVKRQESVKEKNNQRTNKNNKDNKVRHHYAHSKLSKKRVAIPPPKPIDPIQPLMEKFQKEKEVGDIKEHVVEMEKIKPHEAIDKHLISMEPQPDIEPIENHLTKEQSDTIQPIENHQLKMVKQWSLSSNTSYTSRTSQRTLILCSLYYGYCTIPEVTFSSRVRLHDLVLCMIRHLVTQCCSVVESSMCLLP